MHRIRIVAILFVAILLVLGACQSSSTEKQDTSDIPEYSILSEEVYDAPVKTQIVLNLLVSGEISEQGLITLLNQHYSSLSTRTGKTIPPGVQFWGS